MVARRGSPDGIGSSLNGQQPHPPGDHQGRPYGQEVGDL